MRVIDEHKGAERVKDVKNRNGNVKKHGSCEYQHIRDE